MPVLESFGGFPFDGEVFADYMSQQAFFRTAIISSGIVVDDPGILALVGEKGFLGTMPFYNPLDAESDPADNYDGYTDQTPSEIAGDEQTFTTVGRMKSWKAQDFTQEFTGADPLGNVAAQVTNYYQQVWENVLLQSTIGLLGLSGLASHITDIAAASGVTPSDSNKVAAETLIYAKQKALGDMSQQPGLIFMHSMVYARYQALGLLDFDRYTVPDALSKTRALPSIGDDIVIMQDRGLSLTYNGQTAYRTLVIGRGAFLTARKPNIKNAYYAAYDPATKGGVESLFTKEVRVLHPNGVSIVPSNLAKASPTDAELAQTASWELRYNHKNVRIGQILTNG